jgi:hypothetical protein
MIANYTTGVAADRSAAEIERMLVAAGARNISRDYDEKGRGTGLAFAMDGPGGLQIYRLPVRLAGMQHALARESKERRYLSMEHAEKVAWRCVRDWVRAQLALAAAGLVTVDEIMLPYALVGDQTVYDRELVARGVTRKEVGAS